MLDLYHMVRYNVFVPSGTGRFIMKNIEENKETSIFTGSIKIKKIRDYMETNHLTEQEFAKKCKIEVKDLHKVLDDFSCYEPIWILRIARAMRLEFEDLIN